MNNKPKENDTEPAERRAELANLLEASERTHDAGGESSDHTPALRLRTGVRAGLGVDGTHN